MLKLWGRVTSSNVMKVLFLLDELGLPYERVDAGGTFGRTATAEYRAMQPVGLVPALEDGDFKLFESNAILRYIVNAHAPEAAVYPTAPRARGVIDAWLDFQQTTLGPPHTVFFIGLVRTPPTQRDGAAIDKAVRDAAALWTILDARIARLGWIATDDFSLADIAFGVHVHRWYGLDLPGRPDLPHLRAWYDKLLTRPAYARHCAGPLV